MSHFMHATQENNHTGRAGVGVDSESTPFRTAGHGETLTAGGTVLAETRRGGGFADWNRKRTKISSGKREKRLPERCFIRWRRSRTVWKLRRT